MGRPHPDVTTEEARQSLSDAIALILADRPEDALRSVPADAGLLRPVGIHPMKLRFGEKTANGYTTRMFADAWSRSLPRRADQRSATPGDGETT